MILVTGATGFIGRHTVTALLQNGYSVTAVDRNSANLKNMPWAKNVEFIECDLYQDFTPVLNKIPECQALIHLAWAGLPNFKENFHLTQNLPADIKFLSAMMEAGVRHLLVTGTCFEYGMQSGPLSEDLPTLPITAYGIAKDCLRKTLESMAAEKNITWQWLRLFYPYGEGQNPNSLLAALETAINNNEPTFNMSYGEQIRDYISATEIGKIISFLMLHPESTGVINCCSGQPISVRRIVEEYCQKRQSNIQLNLGHYPYPDYEPMAFWGTPEKLIRAGYIFDDS